MEDLQSMQVGERFGDRERRPEMGDQPFGLALRHRWSSPAAIRRRVT